jgi:hypothetical protein
LHQVGVSFDFDKNGYNKLNSRSVA